MNDILVDNVITKWHDYLKSERRYSQHTVDAYLSDLEQFTSFIVDFKGENISLNLLSSLKLIDFRAWLASRLTNNYTAKSNARALSVIKNFYKFLNINYNIAISVVLSMRNPKIKKSLPKALSLDEIMILLNNMEIFESEPWVSARDYALVTFLYATGLRISEALSINYGDFINLTKSSIATLIVKGKGSKQRKVPILPIVTQRINEYLKICPHKFDNEEVIFINKHFKPLHRVQAGSILANIRRQLNLPEFLTPHALRHSFATHMLSKGADLRVIQELLGHADLTSTQLYTKINNEEILKNYKNFHPKGED